MPHPWLPHPPVPPPHRTVCPHGRPYATADLARTDPIRFATDLPLEPVPCTTPRCGWHLTDPTARPEGTR